MVSGCFNRVLGGFTATKEMIQNAAKNLRTTSSYEIADPQGDSKRRKQTLEPDNGILIVLEVDDYNLTVLKPKDHILMLLEAENRTQIALEVDNRTQIVLDVEDRTLILPHRGRLTFSSLTEHILASIRVDITITKAFSRCCICSVQVTYTRSKSSIGG